jgi:NarL family two-component system sensor histidine kinase LiaS
LCGSFGAVLQQAEKARDQNQQLVEELRATQQKLKELAIVEERNRLARDLHDSVKQQVFAISMQLSAARTALSETDKAYQPVFEAERLAQQAGAELTTLIHELRPPPLENKTLSVALREYVTEWSKHYNIDASINIDDNLSLSVNEEQALFRVIQEALSNIAWHSHAAHASVELVQMDSDILLCITDTGRGFDTNHAQMGIGLHSMQERLTQIGASFLVQSEKGHGTQITAKLRRT